MLKRVLRLLLAVTILAGITFALAGTWRDPWLWAYISVFAVIGICAMGAIDEDLARERFNPPSQGADTLSLRFVRLFGFAHLAVGALDSGRFHWTTVPAWLRVVGLVGFGLGFALFVRAMAENRFFSAVVRVQSERGHRVVDTGPYALVRHPGYAGLIPAIPFSGLALGSWLSFAIGLVFSILILRRVRFEDGYLKSNLAGYASYADRVRYRLVPGAW